LQRRSVSLAHVPSDRASLIADIARPGRNPVGTPADHRAFVLAGFAQALSSEAGMGAHRPASGVAVLASCRRSKAEIEPAIHHPSSAYSAGTWRVNWLFLSNRDRAAIAPGCSPVTPNGNRGLAPLAFDAWVTTTNRAAGVSRRARIMRWSPAITALQRSTWVRHRRGGRYSCFVKTITGRTSCPSSASGEMVSGTIQKA
jgi:hypothetical protein